MCKIKKIRPKAPDIASLFAQNRYLYVPIGNPPNRRTRNPAPQPDRRQPIREGTPPIGGPKGAGNPDKRPCDQRSFPTETCCARAEFSFSSTPTTRIFQTIYFYNQQITNHIFLFIQKRLKINPNFLEIEKFALPLQPQSRTNGALVQLVRIRACHARG
ncbi:hypothetical protein, partial [uncultured Alistipes sp.]|uniref:hypothetical protein n=2 Tax=uncultured Alistipes sp. TaxID=538949 RepID=UPI0026027A88